MLPDTEQRRALDKLLRTANKACNWLSDQAWGQKTFAQYALQKLSYRELRDTFGIPAQVAVRCTAKVADAYKLDKNTKRRFKPLGSFAFDDRNLTWRVNKKTVSLGTAASKSHSPPGNASCGNSHPDRASPIFCSIAAVGF